MKTLIFCLSCLVLLCGCMNTNSLKDPKIVADEYIKSSLRSDLVKMTYYETGDKNAFQKKYGSLAPAILNKVSKGEHLNNPNEMKWEVKSFQLSEFESIFSLKFRYPNFDQLGRLQSEYLGFYFENGKLVKRQPFKPNITDDEALDLARKDSRLKFETRVIPLNLKRIDAGWIVSENNKEFSCFMFPKDSCE